MSTGEKAFFNLFARFYYAKNKIEEQIKYQITTVGQKLKTLPETIYILIDEGEIGFHLQWQKEYIQKLVNVLPEILKFENYEAKLQIIFTTHSPMSLSDIPKYNVLFLKDGKQSYEMQEDTFGANIHSLLQNAFFLNGTIGDFAKEKINKMFKRLYDGDIDDNLYKEIKLVSEPFIRSQLLKLYKELAPCEDTNKELKALKAIWNPIIQLDNLNKWKKK
jgi:predicted ATP-binding protein involved in virulence